MTLASARANEPLLLVSLAALIALRGVVAATVPVSYDEAYYWLWEHTHELLKVYQSRYEKIHSYDDMIQYSLVHAPKKISNGSMPPFAQAMPDEFKRADAVEAYRAYYKGAKSAFAKWEWPNAKQPEWWTA